MINVSADGMKVKKTRRRLRLSCVECTKRRQKCDRNHPCSLCVSRGVSHLCRWETVPIARPAPARPPGTAIKYVDEVSEHDAIVQELSTRIANLERALADQKTEEQSTRVPFDVKPSPGSEVSAEPSPVPNWLQGSKSGGSSSREISHTLSSTSSLLNYGHIDISSTIPFPLTELLYESTSTLAQLSLAHHGEFVGRGSLICALHSLTARTTPRFLYSKSTDPTFECRESKQRFSPLPYASHSVQELLSNLPTRAVYDSLIASFFLYINWRYGVLEQWFNKASSQMWATIETSAFHGSEINANWLMLVFAVLASAPRDDRLDLTLPPSRSKDDHFICAMIARRIAKDDYFNTPKTSTMVSPADGTVLACLAIPLLGTFLAERGRVSEAWKLVGNGIRNGQAVGLYRDPDWELWQLMSEEERLLRRRAWWGLFIADRFYSYILGRPHIIHRGTYDVILPSTTNEYNFMASFNASQSTLIGLANLLAETMDMCFNIECPRCITFIEMDTKFESWEATLPTEYRRSRGGSESEFTNFHRQRYILHSWYLIGRTKIYLAAITGQRRVAQLPTDLGRCREMCIKLCMEIIRFQCDFYDAIVQRHENQDFHIAFLASGWLFNGCFSLFEPCVAILATIPRIMTQPGVPKAVESVDRALIVFTRVSAMESGKTCSTAIMAVKVLNTLRDQYFAACRTADCDKDTQIKAADSSSPTTAFRYGNVAQDIDRMPHRDSRGPSNVHSENITPRYRDSTSLALCLSSSQLAVDAVRGFDN